MARRLVLMLAVTFSAGLLFANTYSSIVDARSLSSDIPASIATTRAFWKTFGPHAFFGRLSPAAIAIHVVAVVLAWRAGPNVRRYSIAALASLALVAPFTFLYFYPRNEILLHAPLTDIPALARAASEWSTMNWFRSALYGAALVCDFLALGALAGSGHGTSFAPLEDDRR
jgi:Anthrone oxygenase